MPMPAKQKIITKSRSLHQGQKELRSLETGSWQEYAAQESRGQDKQGLKPEVFLEGRHF